MSAHPEYVLYQTPGSCSRVALNALEEIGVPYREKTVAIMRGDHVSADFIAVNPKCKIPVLVADGTPITELPVILYHLARAHPQAKLLPTGDAPLSDLVWIAGTLHPLAARMFRPGAVSAADPDGVKASASAQLDVSAAMIERRIAAQPWWYGQDWSITDMFLAWVFTLTGKFGYSLAQFPALADLIERAQARPSFVSARAIEIAIADREQMMMPPGMAL